MKGGFKMTKKKQMLLLCLVLLCLTAVYLLTSAWSAKKEQADEEAKEQMLAVTALEKSDICEVTYTDYTDTCTFRLEDDGWYYTEDLRFPLQQDYAQALADLGAGLTGLKKLEEPDALSDYGLDNPSCSITVKSTDDTSTEILYGDVTPNGDYYVTADGGKTIFVADSTLPEMLYFDESQFLQTETFPQIDSTNIQSIKITQGDKVITKYSDREENTLLTCGRDLSGINLDNCVSYYASSDQLDKYGLSKKQRLTVKAVYSASENGDETIVFYMSDIIKDSGESCVYVQLKGSSMVYKEDASDFEALV